MRELRYIIVLIIIIGVFAAPAHAQTLQDQSCMPEIMSIIESRGKLEAQREIIQNQNLIPKPDSILEYSCFEQHVAISGTHTGQMFSEAEWAFGFDDPFVDPYSLDRALYAVVFEGLVNYLRYNFWHRYLGDRSDLVGLPPDGGAGFTCYAMSYVWNRAQCQNFITPRAAQDGFYNFDEYLATSDPRNLPAPQRCVPWSDWGQTIANARRLNAPVPPVTATTRPQIDPLLRHNALFAPDDEDEDCAPPVPTGLYIPPFPGADIEGRDDYTCLTPGCHYNGTDCVLSGG